jgi:hypothetical protein
LVELPATGFAVVTQSNPLLFGIRSLSDADPRSAAENGLGAET